MYAKNSQSCLPQSRCSVNRSQTCLEGAVWALHSAKCPSPLVNPKPLLQNSLCHCLGTLITKVFLYLQLILQLPHAALYMDTELNPSIPSQPSQGTNDSCPVLHSSFSPAETSPWFSSGPPCSFLWPHLGLSIFLKACTQTQRPDPVLYYYLQQKTCSEYIII